MAVSIPDLEQQIADLEAELGQVQYEDLDRADELKGRRGKGSPCKAKDLGKEAESLLNAELSPNSSSASTTIDNCWDPALSLVPPPARPLPQGPELFADLGGIGPRDLAALLHHLLQNEETSSLPIEVAEKLFEASIPIIPDLDGPALAALVVVAARNKSMLVVHPRILSELAGAVAAQVSFLGPLLRPEILSTIAGSFASLEGAAAQASPPGTPPGGPAPLRPGTPVSSAPVSPTASTSILHTPTSTKSLGIGPNPSSPLGISWRSGLSRALLANLEDIEISTLSQCLFNLVVSPSPPPMNALGVSSKLPASLRLILDRASHALPSARMDAGSASLLVSVFASPAVDDVNCATKMARKMCEAPDLNSGHLEEIATATCSHWKFTYAARRKILPLICNRVEASSEFCSPRLVALLAATCAPPHTPMPGGRQHPSGDDLHGLVQSASLLRLCAKHAADAMVSVGPTGVPGGTAWVVKDVIDVANYVAASMEADDCPDKTSGSIFLHHLVDWLESNLVVPTHGVHSSAAMAPGGVYDQLSRARALWQIIRAVACLPEVDQPLVTALANMTEKAVKNSAARPADTQQLAKHLARLLTKRARASGAVTGQGIAIAGGGSVSLWTTLTDRIVRGQGPISVPGAIRALMSLGTTHDSLVSKRPLTKLERASDVEELAEAIALATDPRSNTCKRLFAEKRSLYESDAKAIFAVLSASAVTAFGRCRRSS
ncbi:hypothetical protein FOZ63_024856 [Perkinsus olseni]|uniref:Uncharacterized protein n=2 Tax=Perkinsus olseni TaxID=32597 RepID=A0A7J6U6X1_PEROL|nr:hypothetical protein FOZ63_024856 [Perkinsus olseni]